MPSRWETLREKYPRVNAKPFSDAVVAIIHHKSDCELYPICTCPAFGWDKTIADWVPGFINRHGDFEAYACP